MERQERIGAPRASVQRRSLAMARSAAWAFAGRGGAIGLTFLLHGFLARVSSADAYGTYLIVLAIVLTLSSVGVLGIKPIVVREIALREGDKPSQIIAARYSLLIALVGLSAAAGFLVLAVRLVHGLPELRSHLGGVRSVGAAGAFLGPTAAWIVAAGLRDYVSEVFRGHHEVRESVLLGQLAGTALHLCTAGIFAWALDRAMSARELVWCGAVSQSVVVVVSLLTGYRHFVVQRTATASRCQGPGTVATPTTHDELAVRALVFAGLPLLFSDLAGMATAHASTFVLAWAAGASAVAELGAASRVAAVVTLSLQTTNLFTAPTIARLFGSGRAAELGRFTRGVAGAAVLPAVGLFAVFAMAPEVVLGAVYGERYEAAAAMLVILASGQLVSALAGPCGVVCTQTGHARWTLLSNVLGGGVTLGLAMRLAPTRGALGVASAMCAGIVLRTIVATLMARRSAGVLTVAWLPDTYRLLRHGL